MIRESRKIKKTTAVCCILVVYPMMIHDGDNPDTGCLFPGSHHMIGVYHTCVFKILNLMLDHSEDIPDIPQKNKKTY